MSDEGSLLSLLRELEPLFAAGGTPNTLELTRAHPEWGSHERVLGLCKSLQAREYIQLTQREKTVWLLTPEGESYAEKGMPETNLLRWMQLNPQEGGYELDALKRSFGAETDVALANAMKLGWCKFDKQTKRVQPQQNDSPQAAPQGMPEAIDKGQSILKAIREWREKDQETVEDTEELLLDALRTIEPAKQPDKLLQELKKRKLVETKRLKFFALAKAANFKTELQKPLADLTAKCIASDQWKQQELKPYNFFACGTKLRRGAPHPLMLVQKQFKHVLTAMGFQEMDTNQFVENSFWCFDALYMPQQHPARDAQDTFFIKSPERSHPSMLPEQVVSDVRVMHEQGGCGSTGWKYTWSLDEATKNIMRTHTTAVSARMLHQMAKEYKQASTLITVAFAPGEAMTVRMMMRMIPQQRHIDLNRQALTVALKEPHPFAARSCTKMWSFGFVLQTGVFTPRKLFSIDRVFRNESLDATHLAEFHQVEGVVAGYGLSLGHLMGVMRTFYTAIGIEELRFKPTFNPYTEPSMEIFGFHTGLRRWIEVGNSGMFRPEMLRPLGLPEDVVVIAWGLSLERPTMIKYGLSNIRELFGHKALLGGV
ncbi:phenylalanyl-tRNA synthetase alpha chain [Cyclospora cayetanensis]|uniref:phenylalanine--tRNA ligase n=1 Tax=Cyclospora cayetanensis TaxID=88456 RepID=A0A1D3DAH9_9EIME|nr:phenylalanyl-tRNA synthetase alpha chain [Cyclospora cayetanensis]